METEDHEKTVSTSRAGIALSGATIPDLHADNAVPECVLCPARLVPSRGATTCLTTTLGIKESEEQAAVPLADRWRKRLAAEAVPIVFWACDLIFLRLSDRRLPQVDW